MALFTLHPRLPKDPIERWYRDYCDRLSAVGLHRISHETAGQHLERISPGLDVDQTLAARRIVSLYNELRYGNSASLPEGTRQLRGLVRAFRP